MNILQEKTFTLLKDFDAICSEYNLTYFLSPQLTKKANELGGFEEEDALIDVYMPIKDGLKFVDIVENMESSERSVEYMGNSCFYPSFSVSFVDETTTYLNLNRGTDYSRCGVRIKIQFIRNNVKSSFARILEHGWELNGYKMIRNTSKRNIRNYAVVRVLMTVMGRKRMAKKLFDYLAKIYAGDKTADNRKIVKTFKNKEKYFSKEIFENSKIIDFEGIKVSVPADLENYLESFHKRLTQNDNVKTRIGSSKLIFLPNVPYKIYLEHLEKQDNLLTTYFEGYRREKVKNKFAEGKLTAKNKAWVVACRSRDRLDFYEEFQAKKELINNLYDSEDFDRLDELFSEHERKTRYYLNRGLGFCVSQDIFDLQCELLLRKGEDVMVEKLKRLIPEEHKKPIIGE